MIAIGQFVFYIPFFIMISILFYYIKWTKRSFQFYCPLYLLYILLIKFFLLGIGKQRLY